MGALETEQYIKSVKICGLIKLNSGKGCRICTINTIHKQNIRYVRVLIAKIKEGKWEILVIEYFIFITQNWEVEQTMIK